MRRRIQQHRVCVDLHLNAITESASFGPIELVAQPFRLNPEKDTK